MLINLWRKPRILRLATCSQSRPIAAFLLTLREIPVQAATNRYINGPDEYQACMERIFGDLSFAVAYLDNVVVISSTTEDNLDHLRIVFKHLQAYGVTLNRKKCHLLRTEDYYLGFTLSADGMKPQKRRSRLFRKLHCRVTGRGFAVS